MLNPTSRVMVLGGEVFGRWLGLKMRLWGQRASLVTQMVKNLPAMQETWVWCMGWEDPLEKEMATHSSILAWRIPWTEEPGRLQSMESQRVGHDWVAEHTLWEQSSWMGLVPYKSQEAACFLPCKNKANGSLQPGGGSSPESNPDSTMISNFQPP